MSIALKREGVVELAEALEAVKLGSSKLLVLEDGEGVGIVLKMISYSYRYLGWPVGWLISHSIRGFRR